MYQAAQDEIASRERLAAWRSAETNETAQSLQEFLQKYPTGTEADQARDKLKTLAGYRAELGDGPQSADWPIASATRWRSVSARSLPQVLVLEPDANNHDYRITSAPMSEQDANAACASVKHAGRSCKVVQITG